MTCLCGVISKDKGKRGFFLYLKIKGGERKKGEVGFFCVFPFLFFITELYGTFISVLRRCIKSCCEIFALFVHTVVVGTV